MAETLTIDPTPDAEVAGESAGVEITAEEQDSLQVGESITEAQDQLLAGKYKDAQELEKAYVELQKSSEKMILKIAKQLGSPKILMKDKKIMKKSKKLRNILHQSP